MTILTIIHNFLTKNGFTATTNRLFINDHCEITILDNSHLFHNSKIVHNESDSYFYGIYAKFGLEEKGSIYSKDPNIYWLIGILTYYGYLDRNYKI